MHVVLWKMLQCFLGGGDAASACVFLRPCCSAGLYVGWPEPAETGLRQTEVWQEQYHLCAPQRDRDSPGYYMAALHSSLPGYYGTDPAAAACHWLEVGVLRSAAYSEGGREIWEGTRAGGRGWLGVCESAASSLHTHKHRSIIYLSVFMSVCC